MCPYLFYYLNEFILLLLLLLFCSSMASANNIFTIIFSGLPRKKQRENKNHFIDDEQNGGKNEGNNTVIYHSLALNISVSQSKYARIPNLILVGSLHSLVLFVFICAAHVVLCVFATYTYSSCHGIVCLLVSFFVYKIMSVFVSHYERSSMVLISLSSIYSHLGSVCLFIPIYFGFYVKRSTNLMRYSYEYNIIMRSPLFVDISTG